MTNRGEPDHTFRSLYWLRDSLWPFVCYKPYFRIIWSGGRLPDAIFTNRSDVKDGSRKYRILKGLFSPDGLKYGLCTHGTIRIIHGSYFDLEQHLQRCLEKYNQLQNKFISPLPACHQNIETVRIFILQYDNVKTTKFYFTSKFLLSNIINLWTHAVKPDIYDSADIGENILTLFTLYKMDWLVRVHGHGFIVN